jgi:hypothetical protein
LRIADGGRLRRIALAFAMALQLVPLSAGWCC